MYELLDLGYGRCVMVLATRSGPDPAAEALRRLGVMRVATKYPRIAARHLEETGRQAEIVEVKGSVELAPLAGLAEAIVDLTATGTTLRENDLVVREEICVCTARLVANPVAHKLKAAAIDELLARLRTLTPPAGRGGRDRAGRRARAPDDEMQRVAADAVMRDGRGDRRPAARTRARRRLGGGERARDHRDRARATATPASSATRANWTPRAVGRCRSA